MVQFWLQIVHDPLLEEPFSGNKVMILCVDIVIKRTLKHV